MDTSNSNPNSDSHNGLVFLYPDPKKCLSRVPSLSKVDGLESSEIELLNNWFSSEWKVVYNSGFMMNDSVTRSFTEYLQTNSFIAVDLDKVDSYLSVQKLLYNGLRLELVDSSENVSQCKLFHRYYYTCRENPTSLNNPVVLSNVIWSLKKYKRDEFALTCLVDVLLQSYMVALDSFISLGGVTVIRETFEFLAQNGRLKQSTKFLLKCMDLLDKLDINLEILQTSKIGVHVNSIALAKSNPKLKLDYECGDDKVKLKATNLIKKWKAIRDASMPSKVNDESRVKKSTLVASEKKVEKQHTFESSTNEPEGSFVLNIINTMAEQKEREKKRKLEIRNSQLAAKYKSKLSEEKSEGDNTSMYGGSAGSSTFSDNAGTSEATEGDSTTTRTTTTGSSTSGTCTSVTSSSVTHSNVSNATTTASSSTSGTGIGTTMTRMVPDSTTTSATTRTTTTGSSTSDKVKRHKTGSDYYKVRDSVRSVEKSRSDDHLDRGRRPSHNQFEQSDQYNKLERSGKLDKYDRLDKWDKPESKDSEGVSKDEKKTSDNQLASLMNFFKEYSSKTEDKKGVQQEGSVKVGQQPLGSSTYQTHVPTMVGKPSPPLHPPPVSSLVNTVQPNLPNLQNLQNLSNVPNVPNMPNMPNLQMGSGVGPVQVPVPGSLPVPVAGPVTSSVPLAGSSMPLPGSMQVPNLMEPVMDGRSYPTGDFRGSYHETPTPMLGTFPLLGQALPPGFIPPPPPPPPAPPGHPHFQGVQMDAMGMGQPNNTGVSVPVNYNFEFQNPTGQPFQENQFGFYPMVPNQVQAEKSEDNCPNPPWK